MSKDRAEPEKIFRRFYSWIHQGDQAERYHHHHAQRLGQVIDRSRQRRQTAGSTVRSVQ